MRRLEVEVKVEVKVEKRGFELNVSYLKVEVFNRTGFDLDSVSIEDKYVGIIKKSASVVVTDLKELEMQDNLPFGLATGVHAVSEGNYTFDITLHEGEEGYRLYWGIHQ